MANPYKCTPCRFCFFFNEAHLYSEYQCWRIDRAVWVVRFRVRCSLLAWVLKGTAVTKKDSVLRDVGTLPCVFMRAQTGQRCSVKRLQNQYLDTLRDSMGHLPRVFLVTVLPRLLSMAFLESSALGSQGPMLSSCSAPCCSDSSSHVGSGLGGGLSTSGMSSGNMLLVGGIKFQKQDLSWQCPLSHVG